MLFLIFSIKENRYALQSECILAVVPNILPPDSLRKSKGLRHATLRYPSFFAGFIYYHEKLVPVIDLCLLKAEEACRKHLSSRIILIRYPDRRGKLETLGLLTEKVTETVRVHSKEKERIRTYGEADYLLLENTMKSEEVEIFKTDNLLPDSCDLFSRT